MTQIEIISEAPQPAGWLFDVQWIDPDSGHLHRTGVSLSWADYNLWSASGADEPARVAEAVVRFWLNQPDAGELPTRFDAATLRRHFADADDVIPRMLG